MNFDPNSTQRLSSSLRARSAEASLIIAKEIAESRGVIRVIDTTWLDRIGVAVFASVRPDAIKGTICVNAGKGFTAAEAKIGAYMEAIEVSFASAGRNCVAWFNAFPVDVITSFQNRIDFYEFCPMAGAQICAEDTLAVVCAEEILAGLGSVLVPAELIYYPFLENSGPSIYSTGSNGLASGNNLMEATVHALAEVLERDVSSFQRIKDDSVLVNTEAAPLKVRILIEKIEAAGLVCYLRYAENVFGMAHFSAYVLEPDEQSPISIAGGIGFHPISEIAAVRAIAEAIQSRLSQIHGGRDDVINIIKQADEMGETNFLQSVREVRDRVSKTEGAVNFSDIPDYSSSILTINDALECLFSGLRKAGLQHVTRSVLTESDYPFQVVKVVVPGAEHYIHETARVGPRLLAHFQQTHPQAN